MRRAAARRVFQFLWLLLGLTLAVDGRMVPSDGANVIEPCKYSWQLPGTDCWPPIGQSPRCDHLHSEGCGGSPPTVAHVNWPPTVTHVGHEKSTAAAAHRATEFEDPDCKPVPGRLPPIRCQNPTVKAAREALIQSGKVIEACKYTWQLPGTDCWPPIGQSPRCDHLHSEGCAGSPPTLAHENQFKTAERLTHHEWTELQDDQSDLQIHCEGCLNWPPTVTHVSHEKSTAAAAHRATEFEDPDCKPVPGRLPPIRCQNPTVKAAREALIQTGKVIEACKYTWQLPGTDCWPPIGQSPRCDHLHSEGCAGSPPTVAHTKTAAGADHDEVLSHHERTAPQDPDCVPVPGRLPPIHCQEPRVQSKRPIPPCFDCWDVPPAGA